MSYMNEFVARLRVVMDRQEDDWQEDVISLCSKEVLQSYKNGIRKGEGKKGANRTRTYHTKR